MATRLTACFVILLGVLAGCGSSDEASSTPNSETDCPPEFVCELDGVPFVRAALPSTDSWNPGEEPPGPGETTATVTHPEHGKVCMAGRLESGWAFLTLGFARFDETGVHDALDATALGIDRIEFMLDSPPAGGLSVQLVSAVPDCSAGPGECQHWGFYLSDGVSGNLFLTNQPGVVSAPLSNFVKTATAEPAWEFDPAHLATLQVGAGAFGGWTGDYAFCVSGLKFLDASGTEVSPPG